MAGSEKQDEATLLIGNMNRQASSLRSVTQRLPVGFCACAGHRIGSLNSDTLPATCDGVAILYSFLVDAVVVGCTVVMSRGLAW